MFRRGFLLALACSSLAAPGCEQKPKEAAAADAPVIPVSRPEEREVTDFVDFTGRTDAVQSVDVRARVTGYLTGIKYKEGTDVKKGDLLFEIDARPYQADLDLATARVKVDEAQLKYAEAEFQRFKVLLGKESAAQNDVDKARATRDTAAATLEADKASLVQRDLNLKFTKVAAPISGRVSRYYLTLGNLVSQDQTLLTTIVSLDPMYVFFDMDERTLVRVRKAINEGKIKKVSNIGDLPVLMALPDDQEYTYKGKMTFFNNQVNPSTGTLSARGEFPNPEPPNGIRLLSPGMFVRIRLPIGNPHKALLVIDRALGSDQGLKYVFVLDSDNKVQYRRVKTGALQEDGLRVIEPWDGQQGLKPDDRVIIGGLQQVRARPKIEPELTTMPSLTRPATPEADTGKAKAAQKDKKAAPPGK